MDLKQFVKSVLVDVVNAVEETRKESSRDMHLTSHKDTNQTVEFDIAVTVEDNKTGSGHAGIKVFQLIEGGGDLSHELKNASVSRIKFGVYINTQTKNEEAASQAQLSAIRQRSLKNLAR